MGSYYYIWGLALSSFHLVSHGPQGLGELETRGQSRRGIVVRGIAAQRKREGAAGRHAFFSGDRYSRRQLGSIAGLVNSLLSGVEGVDCMLPDVEPVGVVNERPHTAAAHEVEAEVQHAVVRCQSVDVSYAVGEAAGLRKSRPGLN